MSDTSLRTARICELNDQLRRKGLGGRVLVTPGSRGSESTA
jgi:predicted aconitase with swiveling domain